MTKLTWNEQVSTKMQIVTFYIKAAKGPYNKNTYTLARITFVDSFVACKFGKKCLGETFFKFELT